MQTGEGKFMCHEEVVTGQTGRKAGLNFSFKWTHFKYRVRHSKQKSIKSQWLPSGLNKSSKRQKLLIEHTLPTNILQNGTGVSCTGPHRGCMSNNCRPPRPSNNRSTQNSLLPLQPRVWKLSGLKGNSSQPVLQQSCDIKFTFLPRECQLISRFAYFQKMGGESSCTDTCLPCSSGFFIYIYYKPCQFICIWMWTQNTYIKGFLCLALKTCMKAAVFACTTEALA